MIYLSNIVICHSYIVKLPELELRKYGGILGIATFQDIFSVVVSQLVVCFYK